MSYQCPSKPGCKLCLPGLPSAVLVPLALCPLPARPLGTPSLYQLPTVSLLNTQVPKCPPDPKKYPNAYHIETPFHCHRQMPPNGLEIAPCDIQCSQIMHLHKKCPAAHTNMFSSWPHQCNECPTVQNRNNLVMELRAPSKSPVTEKVH